eukprot:UN34134
MNIFYGYLMMQGAAIVLFSGLQMYGMKSLDEPLAIVARCFWLPLSWGGYWQVGQYLITSPLVDMGCCKWEGWFKALNLLLSFGMLGVYAYFELFIDDPMGNKFFNNLFKFSRAIVYVGNALCLIELVMKS